MCGSPLGSRQHLEHVGLRPLVGVARASPTVGFATSHVRSSAHTFCQRGSISDGSSQRSGRPPAEDSVRPCPTGPVAEPRSAGTRSTGRSCATTWSSRTSSGGRRRDGSGSCSSTAGPRRCASGGGTSARSPRPASRSSRPTCADSAHPSLAADRFYDLAAHAVISTRSCMTCSATSAASRAGATSGAAIIIDLGSAHCRVRGAADPVQLPPAAPARARTGRRGSTCQPST